MSAVPRNAPPGEATGFWHLERPQGSSRPWLVAPDGQACFLLGVNTVMRDIQRAGVSRCAGIREYIRGREEPAIAARKEWARLSDGYCGGYEVRRPYGFNSVGAFSETNDFDDTGGDSFMVRAAESDGAGAPYCVVLGVAPKDEDRALRDEAGTVLLAGFSGRPVGDPFNPAFLADLDQMVRASVVRRSDDPALQMWFAGNEIGMWDVAGRGAGGVRDFRRWVWSDVPRGSSIDRPRCARHALADFLRDRYDGSTRALNRAWDSDHESFAAIVDEGPRPVPFVHDCNERAGEDLQCFVHDVLLRQWVRAVTGRIRRADPNHLIASPRLAIANHKAYRFWTGRSAAEPDHWAEEPAELIPDDTADVRTSPLDLLCRAGEHGFDVVAVNAYIGAETFPEPWFTGGLDRIHEASELPVLISEFGIRARIEGWSNLGGAPAFVPRLDPIEDQLQRGQRYASQMDQFIGCAHVVGASWHAWSDRFNADEPSSQINLGLVQCTDPANGLVAGERWTPLDTMIAETNETILDRIAATTGL